MAVVKIELEFPENVYLALRSVGLSKAKICNESKIALAMELFKRRMLSVGKASELADISLAEFMELLCKNHIPIVDYTDEELKEELSPIKLKRNRK